MAHQNAVPDLRRSSTNVPHAALESMYSLWQVSAKLHVDPVFSPLRQFIDQNLNLWHYEHQLQRRPVIHGRRKSMFIHRDMDWYQPRRSLDVSSESTTPSQFSGEKQPRPQSSSGSSATPLTNVTTKLKELAFLHDRVHTHTSMFVEALNRQFPTKCGAPMWRIPLRPHFDDDTRVEVLAVRKASLTSHSVHAAVNRLWTTLPKDHRGFLSKEVHHQFGGMFFRRVAFDLVDETLRNELVTMDWVLRADGRPSIDWERFTASMLCMLDVYCETADVIEFVEFSEFLHQVTLDAISVGGPLRIQAMSVGVEASRGGGDEDSTGQNAAHYAVGAAAVRDITMRTLGSRNVTLHSVESRSAHQVLVDESVALQQAEPDNAAALHRELRHLGSTRSFLRASPSHSTERPLVADSRRKGDALISAAGSSTAATKSLVGFITALVDGSIPKYDPLTPLDRRTQVTMQLVRGDISSLPPPSRTIPKADLLPPSPAVLLPLRRERPLALAGPDCDNRGSRSGSFRSVSSRSRSFGSLRQMVKPRKIKATVKPDMAEEFLDKYTDDKESATGTIVQGNDVTGLPASVEEPFSFLPRHSSDLVAGDSPPPSFRLRRRDSPCDNDASPSLRGHADVRYQSHVKATGGSKGHQDESNERARRFSDDPDVLACDSEDSDESVEEAVALVERHFTSRRSFFLEARRRTLAESAALAEAMASGRPLERRTSDRRKSGEADAERYDTTNPSFLASTKSTVGHRRQSASVSFRDLHSSQTTRNSDCGDDDDESVKKGGVVASFSPAVAMTRRKSRASFLLGSVDDEYDASIRLQRRSTILVASSVVSEDAFQRTMTDLTSEMSRALTEADRLAHQRQFQWEDRDQQRYCPLRELSVPTRFFKGLAAWKGPMHCPSNDLYPWYRPRLFGVASAIAAVTLRRFANPYVYSLLWEPWLSLRGRSYDRGGSECTEDGEGAPAGCSPLSAEAPSGSTSADAQVAGRPLIVRWYFERDRTWEGEDRQPPSPSTSSESDGSDGGEPGATASCSRQQRNSSGTRKSARLSSPAVNFERQPKRRSRFRGPSLDAADWVPFSDAHCQLLTTWWLEGLTEPRVLPEIPDQLRESDIPLSESDSRPQMQIGFDFSAIRGGRREQKKMYVDFDTWRCGFAEESRRGSTSSSLFRRTSDFFAHVSATGSSEQPHGESEPSSADNASAVRGPRILEGHRICAHQSFLWEYADPSKTAWLPFPLAIQQRLTQWLSGVKTVDRARIAKMAAAVLQTHPTTMTSLPPPAIRKPKSAVSSSQRSKDRTEVALEDQHDPLYETLLEGVPLASLKAFQDHVISLSDNNDGLAMTSWNRSHHITVPIRYSVLFFCRDSADAPIRIADEWLPAPVLRKRFLASRRRVAESHPGPGLAPNSLPRDGDDPFLLSKPPQLTLTHMLTAGLRHEQDQREQCDDKTEASALSIQPVDTASCATPHDVRKLPHAVPLVNAQSTLESRALFQTNRSLLRNPAAAVEAEPPGMRQISVELLAQSCRKILSAKAVLADDPSSRRLDPPTALLSSEAPPFHNDGSAVPRDVARTHHNAPHGLKGSMWKMKRFAHARTGGGMTTTLPVSKHSLAQRGQAGLEAVHAEANFGLDLLASPHPQANQTLNNQSLAHCSPHVRCRSATTTTSAYCRRQAALEVGSRAQEKRQGPSATRAATPVSDHHGATGFAPRDVEVMGLSQLNARLLAAPSKFSTSL